METADKKAKRKAAMRYLSDDRTSALLRRTLGTQRQIERELLSDDLRDLFSVQMVDDLEYAGRVLEACQTVIRAAKEEKDLNDKAHADKLTLRKKQRLSLLSDVLPMPKSDDDARPTLLWMLGMHLKHEEIGDRARFFEPHVIEQDIQRAFGPRTIYTLMGCAVDWRRKIVNYLQEHLWHPEHIPDPDKIHSLRDRMVSQWHAEAQIHPATKRLLGIFDDQMLVRASDTIHRI
ncbi:MAG: hypothetical protein AAGI44_09660 [Pseudomonadota bacterium]